MRISARVDYAICAAAELAAHYPVPVSAMLIAEVQEMSPSFLESILADLRRAGIVVSKRGRNGGFVLAADPSEILVADVMRAQTVNLFDVHGNRPEETRYPGSASRLTQVWIAARAAYRGVFESVTLADLVSGDFSRDVLRLAEQPDSWRSGGDRDTDD